MDKRTNNIIKYYVAAVAKERRGLLKAYLFGSYARKTDNPSSDIDIALVIDNLKDDDKFDLQVQLMLLASKFDTRIEPHPVSKEDFDSSNPFIAEIKKNCVEIAMPVLTA
jgi:predicted nucleotidyltransferase